MAEIKVTKNNNLEVVYQAVMRDEQGVEPIEYDGKQVGLMGYANAHDREVQLQMLAEVLEKSDGNIQEAVYKLSQIAQCTKNEIIPEETVEVDGWDVVLSYKDKKSYFIGASKIETLADLSELNLPTIGKDALKELLIRDTKRVIAEKRINED